MINDCNLQSLNCEDDPFTWVNRRLGNDLIFERLDRFISSFEWRMLYPTALCSSLDFYHPDHRPIYINLQSSAISHFMPHNAGFFRFETMWTREEECAEVIATSWHENFPEMDLMEKFSYCSHKLHLWAQRKFKSLPRQIKKKREQLAILRNHNCWQNESTNIVLLENEVEKLSIQEESYWWQRSRVNWLSSGDKNTKFFHRTASMRHSRNTISGLVSCQGDWIQDSRGLPWKTAPR